MKRLPKKDLFSQKTLSLCFDPLSLILSLPVSLFLSLQLSLSTSLLQVFPSCLLCCLEKLSSELSIIFSTRLSSCFVHGLNCQEQTQALLQSCSAIVLMTHRSEIYVREPRIWSQRSVVHLDSSHEHDENKLIEHLLQNTKAGNA